MISKKVSKLFGKPLPYIYFFLVCMLSGLIARLTFLLAIGENFFKKLDELKDS